MKYHKLLKLITEYIQVNDADIKLVETLFEPITFQKNDLLEEINKIAKYLYFINSGFVRVFYLQDGNEITTHINCPPGFITSFNSFVTLSAANDNVKTITSCELLRITKKNFDTLNSHSQKWADFGKIIYERSLLYNEQRTNDLLTLSAEQRYLKLLSTQPEIVQNVPLQYISSYLGIEPQSLSRIRKKIIS